jgi:hypothetical protein
MKDYLIHCAQEATGHNSNWDKDIFDKIAWKQLSKEAYQKLSTGQWIQLLKYINDILPALV